MNDVVVEQGSIIEIVSEGIQGPQGVPGPSGNATLVIGEVPAGTVNGSNATFTTAFSFIPASVAVFINGLMQKLVDDFTTTGTQTINMNVSPVTGDKILVNYLR